MPMRVKREKEVLMKWARLFIIVGIVLFGICLLGNPATESAPDYYFPSDCGMTKSEGLMSVLTRIFSISMVR